MKKSLKTLLSLAIVTSLAYSNDFDQDLNDEFQKMQSFFHSVMNSSLKNKYFNNNYPKIDMQETTSSFIISFDLAGMDKEDIKLTLDDNNILKIEGEKKNESLQKSDTYIKKEMFIGKFQRSVKLPQNINSLTLKTKYIDGILKVTINKMIHTNTNSKVIPIN